MPRRRRPLARIEPVRKPTPVRRFGNQRGRMRIKGDIVHADAVQFIEQP